MKSKIVVIQSKLVVLLFLITHSGLCIAQQKVDVYTGASYLQEVYYSLNDSLCVWRDRAQWDLAFATDNTSLSVLSNGGLFTDVYTYPKGDTSSWNKIDTSGILTWKKQYNSLESWDEGAFNRNLVKSNSQDCGWGVYHPEENTWLGDSIFIVRRNDSSYIKMCIDKRDITNNSWTFRWAQLDGSKEKKVTIDASIHEDLNFVHYNFSYDTLYKHEPYKDNWQLYFNVCFDYTIPYILNSVWVNKRVTVQEVDDVIPSQFIDYEDSQFVTKVSEIGGDWKTFSPTLMKYVIDTNRLYFVKFFNAELKRTEIWKLYFTGFAGMTIGRYSFVQQKIFHSGIDEIQDDFFLQLSPNPTKNEMLVLVNSDEAMNYQVFSVLGICVWESEQQIGGFNRFTVNTAGFNPGCYYFVAKGKSKRITKQFLKM